MEISIRLTNLILQTKQTSHRGGGINMVGLKPENDINQNLKAPEIRTGEIPGLTENSKNQTCSNLFNPRRRRTINQSFGKIVQGSLEKVQGSKFDVVTNRRVS
ncbi:MAG: hypothetical protein L6Q59_17210, partial [Ignavibacteriaceae bacterium]|nr:hypothetical protein [Ignavibacteriaceae bacterium]